MNAKRGLASIFILSLVASGAAQTKTRGKTKPVTLAQAVVVEIYEHNLGKAIDMYRQIAADTKRTEDTRTQAFLRLGKAYRRLGQTKEAEANLQKAARGKGNAAKEAAMLLSGEGVDDGDLVKAKVKQALAAMRLTGKPDRSDLAWIGQPAVPYVIKANKEEKADLRFLQNTATVLCQLGGPEVLKWIEATKASDDVLRKRAVIKGYRYGDKMVRAKLVTFMTDKDVTVRREVVNNSNRILTAGQLVDTIADADEVVREKALSTLRHSWLRLDHEGDRFATFSKLLPILEKADLDPPGPAYHAPGGLGLASWLQGYTGTIVRGQQRTLVFPRTDVGRRTALRAAGLRAYRSLNITWPTVGATEEKNVFVEEILVAARAQEVGAQLLYEVLGDVLPSWDRSAMAAVLELVKRGYDHSNRKLARWVTTHGVAADIPAVAVVLGSFDSRSGIGNVCQWMSKVGAPREVLQQLIQFANHYYEPGRSAGGQNTRFYQVLHTIRSINSKESIDYIVGNMLKGRQAFYRVLEQRHNDLVSRAILRRMLTAPDKTEAGIQVRKLAFQHLIGYHDDPADPRDFARAYEIGMGETGPAYDPRRSGSVHQRGLYYIVCGRTNAKAEIMAKVLDACLATGQVEAFKDLATVSGSSWRNHAMGAAMARNMVRCPELLNSSGEDVRGTIIERILRAGYGGDALVTLELAALTHKDAAVRRSALKARDRIPSDPRIVKALMTVLKSEDSNDRYRAARRLGATTAVVDGLVEAMTALLDDEDVNTISAAIGFLGARAPDMLLAKSPPLLAHENTYLRYHTVKELLARHGTKVIDQVGKVLLDKDIEKGYRKSLIKPFGSLMSLKVVPHLLRALKDPDLQSDAQKQLEAVRFYHEQSSKWSKLIEGSGFTETTAVEALIKQAKSGNKEVRLAAIASLGTLADPESLPFLVGMIADSDQEIRNAAKAAVQRINTADRKKK